jgi:hypothetical protein
MEFVTDGDVMVAEYTRGATGSLARPVQPVQPRELNIPVWVIIDCARTVGFDVDRVAARYGISTADVTTAFEYYQANKPLIDAQISTCVEPYI